jgi:hypothetical protein
LRDPELRHSHLGVSVFHRIATLWGEVISLQLGERARNCLRRIIELQEIREEWHVMESEPGGKGPALPPLRERAPLASTLLADSGGQTGAKGRARIQGTIARRPGDEGQAPGADPFSHLIESRPPDVPGVERFSLSQSPQGRSSTNDEVAAAQALRQELGWRPGPILPAPAPVVPPSQEPDSLVLPSIRLTGPAAALPANTDFALQAIRKQPESKQPASSAPEKGVGSFRPLKDMAKADGPKLPTPFSEASSRVIKEIETLRRSSPHFSQLRAELDNGVVSLSGSASRWEQVYDLGRAIARMPGVKRVVFKDVQADP